jgi:hypothetical protein
MLTVPHATPSALPLPPVLHPVIAAFAVPTWHAFPAEEREDEAYHDDDDTSEDAAEGEDRRDSHRSAVRRSDDEWGEASHELDVTTTRARWRDDSDDSDDFEPTLVFDRT